jgi:quaternary ammonium compound-resistance protein SugE
MHWVYLLIASFLEICWLYCVKFLSKERLLSIDWQHFFASKENISALAPLLGYIGFGIGNVVFFAMAMRQIPASTAFAVWMGVAMVGARICDAVFFGQPVSLGQLFFMLLVVTGIVGLKWISG